MELPLAVLCSPQLGLHCGQFVPQLRVNQQEALQLLLKLGGGARELAGGAPRPAAAPPHAALPSRPALTASVSWLRCSSSRLCARSSSRCLSVTSLSCRRSVRSSKERVSLAPRVSMVCRPQDAPRWLCCCGTRTHPAARSLAPGVGAGSPRLAAAAPVPPAVQTPAAGGVRGLRVRACQLPWVKGGAGDSPSPGRAPRRPFPRAPALALLVARAQPPRRVRNGVPAVVAQCPEPQLDGTRALRLTPRPLPSHGWVVPALLSWAPFFFS